MAKVKDKATAFKNELAGSTTNKILCKAASHEVAGPKKKHVDYLLQLTNNPNCQMTVLSDLLAERLKHSSWVVVFKALIVSHNLMSLGHEKFSQCLATRSHIFELENFNDRSDFLATDMSVYVRKYARYLNYVCKSYKVLAFDVCRSPKGDNSPFRKMDTVKIVKAAGIIQQQLDFLLEVELSAGELTNGVINTAFLMLYKDLIKLYTVYNDILVNLLDSFFEMKKPQCRETIEIYRKFLIRQEGVQHFLHLAEDVGVDKQTHKDLRQVPDDLLPALEEHVSELNSLKKANAAQASPVIKAASEKLAALKDQAPKKDSKISTRTPSQSSFSSGLPSGSDEILEAQRKRFDELKRQSTLKKSPSDSSESTNAETQSQPAKQSSGMADLFSLDTGLSMGVIAPQPPQQQQQPAQSQFNPWGDASVSAPTTSTAPQTQPLFSTANTNPFQNQTPVSAPTGVAPATIAAANSGPDPWGRNAQGTSSYQEVDLFSEIRLQPDFDNVFGGQQQVSNSSLVKPASVGTGQFTMGGVLQPVAVGPLASKELVSPQPVKLTKDVDSSLERAAANLSLELGGPKIGVTKKTEHQWTAPKGNVKTGGPNYMKQTLQPKTLPPAAMQPPSSVDWSKGMYAGHFPVNPQAQQQQQQPHPYMMGGQQSMFMQPAMQQPNAWGQQPPPQQRQQVDPFGPLGAQAPLF